MDDPTPATRPRAPRLPPWSSDAWLAVIPLAALATASAVMWLFHLPGGDDAAHLYKIELLRQGRSVVWDNLWYAGSYGAVTYGILFYWLARWVTTGVLVVLAGGLLPLLFRLYLRRAWGISDRLPAWCLAAVLVVYLSMGQSPFLVALCMTMGGLVLLSGGRPVLAALLWSAALFTNPLAAVAAGIFVLGDLVAHRTARRQALIFALALLPAFAARVALAVLFAEPALEFRGLSSLARLLAFSAAGWLLARASADPKRRPLQWVFVAYAVVVLPVFLVPALPVGSNVGRFFAVFGAPLLVAVAWPTRLPRWAPAVALIPLLSLQLQFPVWQLVDASRYKATRATFFAPALTVAKRLYEPDYRFHVVAPERHWEAYYFAAAGYPLTRGWLRQADALHNEVLYDAEMTAADYERWLREMGVRDVFVPHAPLVPASRREAELLATSPAFAVVHSDPSWTVYRLQECEPIVTPCSTGASAEVQSLDHTTVRFTVSRPGEYRIKVTWSPYWLLSGDATAAPAADDGRQQEPGQAAPARPVDTSALRRDGAGLMIFAAPAPGLYTLRFDALRVIKEKLFE